MFCFAVISLDDCTHFLFTNMTELNHRKTITLIRKYENKSVFSLKYEFRQSEMHASVCTNIYFQTNRVFKRNRKIYRLATGLPNV